MADPTLCIICCDKKIDYNLDLGTCKHQEFCTQCCVIYFEKAKHNICPSCTKEVADFIVCSNKIINTMQNEENTKKECCICFDTFNKRNIIEICRCGAVICKFCHLIQKV